MVPRMEDDNFREEQMQNRYAKHIAPFNEYVDELRKSGRGWAPYVAPVHGGTKARLLCVLRDPGPGTHSEGGSGFLCMENADETAKKFRELCAEVGLKASDMVPWNAYPWYINRKPNAAELKAGVEPLKCIIELMPKGLVVMLFGGEAKNVGQHLLAKHPNIVVERGLRVIKTYHTGRQAFICGPIEKESRKKHQRDAFSEAAQYLRDAS